MSRVVDMGGNSFQHTESCIREDYGRLSGSTLRLGFKGREHVRARTGHQIKRI